MLTYSIILPAFKVLSSSPHSPFPALKVTNVTRCLLL